MPLVYPILQQEYGFSYTEIGLPLGGLIDRTGFAVTFWVMAGSYILASTTLIEVAYGWPDVAPLLMAD